MYAINLQRIYPKRFLNALIKWSTELIFFVTALHLHQANAQDLVLQDMTITGTVTFSESESITAGPNFTITSSGYVIFGAPLVILKPGFSLIEGGELRVVSEAIAVDVNADEPPLPNEFVVHQNYPNPFNPTTQIRYVLPKAEHVQIVIYNLYGQAVKTVVSEYQKPGFHSVIWDGTSNEGDRVSSGLYYYKVTAGNDSRTKKMIYMK